ncbi:MAG: phosphoribosylformylglycinamidine cyclo-ligase [Pirellulaceae bacterium]
MAKKKNQSRSPGRLSYRDAGVDLDIYGQSMKRLPRLMHQTFSPRVMQLDGGFAGLFQLDGGKGWSKRNYRNPVLVSGTDGVGTKLKIAQMSGRHETVGIDLVAMCVNDVICCGAEPLFFLDYVAMSHDDPDTLEQIVTGVSEGCLRAGCALLAGETAIMPDLYRRGEYDLAGFHVGVVEKQRLIDGRKIESGDVVIGLASSGIHSNGFSLVRKIVFDAAGHKPRARVKELENQRLADILLTPTTIYAEVLGAILENTRRRGAIHGIAHITGGGMAENIERILPGGVDIVIDGKSWDIPPVFPWLKKLGNVSLGEMYRVFNMGIGMALIVKPTQAAKIQQIVADLDLGGWQIGVVRKGRGKVKFEGRTAGRV